MTFKSNEFEVIFMYYYPKVKNFARKLIKSEEDAEDIAQDVFIKFWKVPEIWSNNDQALDSYLYTMTKNTVIDLIRKRVNEVDSTYVDFSEISTNDTFQADSFLSEIYYKEIQLIIKLTIDQMPDQRKRIFKMSRSSGMSNKQIAHQLNISVRTVEHHIYLALSELKKVLIIACFLIFH